LNNKELKEYLDFKASQYETIDFITNDPIKIPHQYQRKEDIEICAFFIATIAWGNRISIIKSGEKLMRIWGDSPYKFIMEYESNEIHFIHRTFNSDDFDFFCRSLQEIYRNGGLEKSFQLYPKQEATLYNRIINFRTQFLSVEHSVRSEKHLSNPSKNSACKRMIMFLRWMVRDSKNGVDFGIWKSIGSSELYIPLDVHTGNIARKLRLIKRKQNDWKTNEELISKLRKFDPLDPGKYDFALFGIGVNKEI